MTQSQGIPDASFLAEFGEGELGGRLWRGGLRVENNVYKMHKAKGIRSLTIALRDGLDIRVNDGTVEKVISDLETCWNDSSRMRRACSPISIASGQTSALSLSLVKVILSIDLFQSAMMTCIVNKISELGEDSCVDKDVAHTLLNQLRWLDFIVDGPALCESLLSIVPIISPSIQKELIEALPEILDDSTRDKAVTELIRVLEESPSMMGSVVDALGALGVGGEQLSDVNTSIISSLAATNRDMLPVTLKYLLQSCPQDLLTETVNALRHTLALSSLGPGVGKLCLDAAKSGLRMSKLVADHVIVSLKKLENPSDHKPADLWLLIALSDSPLHRKQAEVVFRKKAAQNVFTRILIDSAIAPFAESFVDIADRLLYFASLALQFHDIGARRTGVIFYTTLFRLLQDRNVRRKVISSLLDHTGTRRLHETDAALEALSIIATESENDISLLPFSALVQGLLDYLEFFNDFQLRQIWTALGFLCRATSKSKDDNSPGKLSGKDCSQAEAHNDPQDSAGGSELASLEILLRKELTHADTFYRRMGVIGASTMIKVLGSSVQNNILSMLLDTGRADSYSQALSFDELAENFSREPLPTKETAEMIRKTICLQFEKRYLKERSEMGPLVKDEMLIPSSLYGNLEGKDSEVCFSIAHLIRNEPNLDASRGAVRAMVPNLRLLCVLTLHCFDGSLSEVDAVIGAPLHLPLISEGQNLEDLTLRAKTDLLLSLFVAHGWMVELVNAFAEQESSELRAKCVKRVDHLLDITSKITLIVSQLPNWADTIFDSYSGTRASTKKNDGNRIRSSKRNGALKEKSNSTAQTGKLSLEWKRYSRQLHPSALSLIRITTPLSYRFTETDTELLREGDPVMETVSLSPAGLEFLLSELLQYLEGFLGSDIKFESPFVGSLIRKGSIPVQKSQRYLSFVQGIPESPLTLVRGLKVALTSLGKQLKRSLSRILPDSDDTGDVNDTSSLETDRKCIALCLKCLTICLSSRALCDGASQHLLFDVLASIRFDGEASVDPSDPFTDRDIHAAGNVAFEQLRGVLKSSLKPKGDDDPEDHEMRGASLLELEGCCGLLAAMDAIFSHCSGRTKEELGQKYSDVACEVLGYNWNSTTLRSRKTQKLIPGIIRIHVQNAKDPLAAIEALREELLSLSEKQANIENEDEGVKRVQSDQMPLLTEQTFFSFTVSVLEQYMFLFKRFQPSLFERQDIAFGVMTRFIRAELPLYTLARRHQNLLGPVMRAGRTLVDLFLKICLPFLREHFKKHRSMVIQVCKMHQKPTRLLQTLCAHSKFTRDTSLTSLVPPLRKSLELLLYRVKEVLQVNNAKGAFQLGNLKHRDINGEVLSSQHLQYKSESEESEYSSLALTDEDEDEIKSRTGGRSQRRTQNKSQRSSQRKQKKPRLGFASSPQAQKKRKISEGVDIRRESAKDLDLGSDVEQMNGEQRIDKVMEMDKGDEIEKVPLRKIKRRSKVIRDSEEEREQEEEEKGEERSRVKKKRTNRSGRHPLIDDEAGVDEEAEDDDDDLREMSQFIFEGEEEEAD
ncbi:Fanconi anemia group D2 protein [Gracilariopsis chorda]|uniref:Fanconi anemia group D2 protein n=1 Tax=Gracilariopsis chorda TaxID=448386 RepID=A0A2V3IZI3_9FLOR|nr:Fanconi anemia group D2 protein [Gracilariopsis chorda]|eukprot:PXF47554.1 Fanconi anemia group D2 protein [Gracilariopsis chorda]